MDTTFEIRRHTRLVRAVLCALLAGAGAIALAPAAVSHSHRTSHSLAIAVAVLLIDSYSGWPGLYSPAR